MAELHTPDGVLDLGAFNWIGRDPYCKIQIDHWEISRLHALIARSEAGWFLLDFRSTNGIRLNGAKVDASCPLEDEDTIDAGPVKMIFRAPEAPRATQIGPRVGTERRLPTRFSQLMRKAAEKGKSLLPSRCEDFLTVILDELPAQHVAYLARGPGGTPGAVAVVGANDTGIVQQSLSLLPPADGTVPPPSMVASAAAAATAMNPYDNDPASPRILSFPIQLTLGIGLLEAQRMPSALSDPEERADVDYDAQDVLFFAAAAAWLEGLWRDLPPPVVHPGYVEQEPAPESSMADPYAPTGAPKPGPDADTIPTGNLPEGCGARQGFGPDEGETMPELRWGRHAVRLKTRMWIGADTTCPIRIEDKHVDPRHGFILAAKDGWYFLDYRTNGKSALNGRRCDLPVRLLDGDTLLLGKTQVTFHFDDEEQAAQKARRQEQPANDPILAVKTAYEVQQALRTIYEPNRERVTAFVGALSALLGDARVELHLAGGTIETAGAFGDLSLPPPDWTLSRGMTARSLDLAEQDGAPALSVIEVPLARRGGRGLLRALRPTSFTNLELLLLTLGGFGLQARLGNRPVKD